MSHGPIELSVIVVTFNARELLARCLRSLEVALSGLSHEIILVDNASRDGAADMVVEQFPGVRLLRNDENLGYPQANNQGIAVAQGSYVMLLNPDTEVPPGVMERLLAEMQNRPRAGGVAPALRLPGGRIQVSFGRRVNVWTESIKKMMGNRWLSRHVARDRRTREVFWLGGACLLTRRDILEQTRGFDERFFLYFEDIDLCFRIRDLGWRLYFVPEAEIPHVGGASTSGLHLLGRYHYRRSQLYFYRKHGSALSRLALNAYLVMTFCALYLKGILHGTGDLDLRKRFFLLLRER